MTDSLITYLQRLAQMTPQDLALLQKMTHPLQAEKHRHLLVPGEPCRKVYFILQGCVRLYFVSPEGAQINRRFMFEDSFAVDFQSFLTQQPSRYYLQAMEDTSLLSFGYEDLQHAYAISKGWERLGRLLAERGYQNLHERVELLQFYSPEERYQYILESKPELLKRIPQFHLASYLGIKPESLSRLKKRIGTGRT